MLWAEITTNTPQFNLQVEISYLQTRQPHTFSKHLSSVSEEASPMQIWSNTNKAVSPSVYYLWSIDCHQHSINDFYFEIWTQMLHKDMGQFWKYTCFSLLNRTNNVHTFQLHVYNQAQPISPREVGNAFLPTDFFQVYAQARYITKISASGR